MSKVSIASRVSQTGEEGGDNTMVQAVLNIPLIEDKLAIRGVAYRFDNSGYINNVPLTQSSPRISSSILDGGVATNRDDIGNDQYTGFRLTALWQPMDALDITLGYLHQEIEQDGRPEVNLLLSGDYEQRSLNTGVEGISSESLNNEIGITNLVVNYDLGWGDITSSSSWVNYDTDLSADVGQFTGGPYYESNSSDTDSITEELRLSSRLDGPVQFVAGIYYEKSEQGWDVDWLWSGDISLDPGVPFVTRDIFDVLKQKAFFGEISYAFSDQLTATFGGRSFDFDRENLGSGTFLTTQQFEDRLIEGGSTGQNYKANISYTPDEDTLVYGQWAEGFRLGITQPQPPNCSALSTPITAPSVVEPDTTENFELGLKSSMANNRITLNAAIYRIDWEGIPVVINPEGNCFYTDNAGKAESEGIELEIQARLTDSFLWDLSASYVESTLSEDAPNLGPAAVEGANLPGSADYNISLGLQYDFSLASRESFTRVDYTYIGEYFNSFAETGAAAGGFGQLNLKAGITFDQLTLDFFINNLTNQDGLTWVETISNSRDSEAIRAYRVRPRTVGFNLGYHF